MANEKEKPHPWRRRIVRTVVLASALVVMLAAAGPSLIPSSWIADAVSRDLGRTFDRPVKVSGCRLGWLSGVEIDEIEVGAGPGADCGWLLRIEGLRLGLEPWELASLAGSDKPNLGRTTIRRLLVRVTCDAQGQLNMLQVKSGGGPAPDFKSIEVLSGAIELQDQRSNTHRQVKNLRIMLGRIAESQKAYVTASGRLLFADQEGRAGTGVLSLDGLLDHFDLNRFADITGGCNLEWTGIDLVYFVPTLRVAGAGEFQMEAPTDGQVKVSIDASDLIRFDGSISLSRLLLSGERGGPEVDIDRLTLGFIGGFNKSTGHATLEPVQLAGAGSTLQIRGNLDRQEDGQIVGDLNVTGTLGLTPLKEDIRPLGKTLNPFGAATGSLAIASLDVKVRSPSVAVKGEVNLTRTELSMRPWFVKPVDRQAVFLVDATADLATGDLVIADASLAVEPGNRDAGAVPLSAQLWLRAQTMPGPAPTTPWSRPIEVNVNVPNVRQLAQHVPAAGRLVDDFEAAGALAIRVTVQPGASGVPTTLRVDGRDMSFGGSAGEGKEAGAPFGATLSGLLDGRGGLPECRNAELTLKDSSIRFDGNVYAEAIEDKPDERRVRFDGQLATKGVQEWLALARPWMLRRPYLAVVGNLSGALVGHADPREVFVDLSMEATRASVELHPSIEDTAEEHALAIKRLGKVAQGRLVLTYRPAAGKGDEVAAAGAPGEGGAAGEPTGRGSTLDVALTSVVDETTTEIHFRTGRAEALADSRLPEPMTLDVSLHSKGLASLVGDMPLVASRVGRYKPTGEIDLHVGCRIDKRLRLEAEVDLTGTEYESAGELKKVAGLRQAAAMVFESPLHPTASLLDCRLEKFEAVTGPTSLIASGTLKIDPDAARGAQDLADLLVAVRSVDATTRLDLVQDDSLQAFSRRWRELSTRYKFRGKASVQVEAGGQRDEGRLHLAVNATEAGFEYGEGTEKPEGTPAAIDVSLTTGSMAGEIEVKQATFDVADAHVTASGTVYSRRPLPRGLDDLVGYSLHIEGRAAQLARVARLVPEHRIRAIRPQGGVDFVLDLAADRYGTEVDLAQFNFSRMRLMYGQTPLLVDGGITLNRRRFRADALRVSLGESSVLVAADVSDPLVSPAGEVTVTGEMLDLDAVARTFGMGTAPAGEKEKAVGIPSDWPNVAGILARAKLTGRVTFDRFNWSDEGDMHYHWSAFASDFNLSGGLLDVSNFKAVMMGGVVVGHVVLDVHPPNPILTTQYETRNLAAGEGLAPLIDRLFPNMTVNGKAGQVYEARQNLFATVDESNYPVGSSFFESTDGFLEGPAAPDWMTNLLPGLKLSRFDFRRMESLTAMRADGSASSQMLFDGTSYPIYINGTTDAEGRANYVLGVDLFNSLGKGMSPPGLQEGQVPLMRYSGVIRNSKWQELNIEFLLPHDVAYQVFVKRSLVARLLQGRGETRRPDFKPYRFTPVPGEKDDAGGGDAKPGESPATEGGR